MAAGRENASTRETYHPSRRMAIVFGLLASMFWGSSFVGVKYALREFSPIALLVFRYGIALIIMAPIVHRLEGIRLPEWRQLPALIALGALGVSLNQLFQGYGLLWTTASQASWLTAIAPALIAVMGWIFLSEALTLRQGVGLMLSMLGAVFVSHSQELDAPHAVAWWGPGIVLLGALAWAGFTVLGKHLVISLPALHTTYAALLTGWLIVLPFFFGTGAWQGMRMASLKGWMAILFLAVICTVGAYTFYFLALRGAETAVVAVVQYLEPVVTIVLAGFILQERLTWVNLAGCALILIGVFMVERANVKSLRLPVS